MSLLVLQRCQDQEGLQEIHQGHGPALQALFRDYGMGARQ